MFKVDTIFPDDFGRSITENSCLPIFLKPEGEREREISFKELTYVIVGVASLKSIGQTTEEDRLDR